MAYNPSIAYSGPDGATRSVTDELTSRFGKPDRPYEFVTGWKDAGNVSGHNPDSNGTTHGVDIFLTQSQNRWAADHLAARGRAGDPRVGYVIYAGQIASPSTGYHFAGSGWEHWDHPHLSVWDGYWGGYCSLPASIYNDTSSWGIDPAITGQANTITPIPEGDQFMNLSYEDQTEMRDNLRKLVGTANVIEARTTRYLDTKISAVAEKVVSYEFPKLGIKDEKGKPVQSSTTIKSELGWLPANVTSIRNKVDEVKK